MALLGECTGKNVIKCDDCGKLMFIEVLHSNAGYYIGFHCSSCGPYSRESGYYKKSIDAQKALDSGDFDR